MAPFVALLTVASIVAPPMMSAGPDDTTIDAQHASTQALGTAEARAEETEDDSDERSFFFLGGDATVPPASSVRARFVPHAIRAGGRPRVCSLARAPPRV